MRITDLEEEILSFDWYAVDSKGEIARLISCGMGFLPESVKASKDDLDVLERYFRTKTAPTGKAKFVIEVESDKFPNPEHYTRLFSMFPERGLFSFDSKLEYPRPNGYFLVAKPTRPLTVDELPLEIRSILERTRMNIEFSEVLEVNGLRS